MLFSACLSNIIPYHVWLLLTQLIVCVDQCLSKLVLLSSQLSSNISLIHDNDNLIELSLGQNSHKGVPTGNIFLIGNICDCFQQNLPLRRKDIVVLGCVEGVHIL